MRIGYSQEQAPSVIVRPTQSSTAHVRLRVVPVVITGCEQPRATEADVEVRSRRGIRSSALSRT
jgi:hypothetical protein